MTNHTCKFCGTVASPGQNCSSLEQAWLSTPSRPYGCQWFDAESRKLHPRPLADAAQGTGKLLADLDNLRKKIAAEIVEANDCGETIYAEALCEMDELFARCETALASQPPAAPVSRPSAGSEGEPFMMLSCREAKQCLHNIPGCICDGDPTNG